MQRSCNYRALGKAFLTVPVYLIVALWGLQYSFYVVFSQLRFYDDEGTMMLRVRAFIDNPAAYDSLSGMYGPFYYLHKYAIYGLLDADVSHDLNRLTTTVFWALIAGGCAYFVHRVSRSIVLAAIVQMQMILHLSALANEPGHPHEIALVLIVTALLLASFAGEGRRLFGTMAGLGAAAAALSLVKINLGLYLCAPLALTLLQFLPRRPLVRGLKYLAAIVALVLPAAIMWRHLHLPWARNYCALVTSLIASSLLASSRENGLGALKWEHIAVVAGSATLTVACVCATIIAWGSSVSAVVNSVILRAIDLPSSFLIAPPVPTSVVAAAAASLALALCYALAPARYWQGDTFRASSSVVKLAYGCFVLYGAYRYGPSLLTHPFQVPLMWLLLIGADSGEEAPLRERFPRTMLCLLAAFQTLQAYPIYGSQARWAVFLIVPVAAICIGDALRAIAAVAERRRQAYSGLREHPWARPAVGLALLCCASIVFYRETDVAGLKTTYAQQAPLGLPGATRLRLPPLQTQQIRWAVANIESHCDGFIGMPGFASLYFWTRISPPAIVNNAWTVNLGDDGQRAIVETMETYERPCVLYNPTAAKFWSGGRPPDPVHPLVRYIQEQYRSVAGYGPYALLMRSDASTNTGSTGRRS